MKKVTKILVIMAIIAVIMAPMMVFASEPEPHNPLNEIDTITDNYAKADTTVVNELQEAGGTIYATIQSVGIILALIIVVVFGVQWLVATPAKKAELKGKMWNIIIGIAIILLASTLISQVGSFISSLNLE